MALLPQDVTDVRGRISELIARYYDWLEVEPYKKFFSPEQTAKIVEHNNARSLEEAVAILRSKGMNDIGAEEGRIYRLSTFNPNARWDYWGVGGNYDRKIFNEVSAGVAAAKGWDEHLCANVCIVSLLPHNAVPASIITPDGEWHDCEDFGWGFMKPDEEKEKTWSKWENHARQLLHQYADHFAIGLDVHC